MLLRLLALTSIYRGKSLFSIKIIYVEVIENYRNIASIYAICAKLILVRIWLVLVNPQPFMTKIITDPDICIMWVYLSAQKDAESIDSLIGDLEYR